MGWKFVNQDWKYYPTDNEPEVASDKKSKVKKPKTKCPKP